MVTRFERGEIDDLLDRTPEPGTGFVAVTFELEDLSRVPDMIASRHVSIVDHLGRNVTHSAVDTDHGSNVTIVRTYKSPVAPCETAGCTIVFEVARDADVQFFAWQPEGGVHIMIDVRDA